MPTYHYKKSTLSDTTDYSERTDKFYFKSIELTKAELKVKNLTREQYCQIGKNNEAEIHFLLDEYFNTTFYADPNIYGKHDFYNNEGGVYFNKSKATKAVEVKSRLDITHNRWWTAFIDKHKVDAQIPNIEYYYVYIYADGIFYIKYDKVLFDTFDINNEAIGYREDVGRMECSPRYEIPYKHLTKICDLEEVI
jgi:hypothetical protein